MRDDEEEMMLMLCEMRNPQNFRAEKSHQTVTDSKENKCWIIKLRLE